MEQRILLKNSGTSDQRTIQAYRADGGFKALEKALHMRPGDLIREIINSGLTGRGGAGFPCGIKWEAVRSAKGNKKFLICNADEGEVGTFKDLYLLNNNPFAVLEGMLIAGYAIGIPIAYIYMRAEYHRIYPRLMEAIQKVSEAGLSKHMRITVFEGAGAYVCGEESALVNSLEGNRGESRYKPPFPAIEGLWRCPTLINNVETLATIPAIITNGATWFSQMGTAKSKGSKLFCVSGDVARPGVYELVMGSSLKELVVDRAGATDIKAVQVGGACGRLIPFSEINMSLSHETVMGSGAVVVLNSSRSIIDAVYNNVRFMYEESCGKCTPCRDGLRVMFGIYEKFIRNQGNADDCAVLEHLSSVMTSTSLCGLGQSAPVPVVDSLKYFAHEYQTMIEQSRLIKGFQPGIA